MKFLTFFYKKKWKKKVNFTGHPYYRYYSNSSSDESTSYCGSPKPVK